MFNTKTTINLSELYQLGVQAALLGDNRRCLDLAAQLGRGASSPAISFAIRQLEHFGRVQDRPCFNVMGPTGSGKSAIMKIVADVIEKSNLAGVSVEPKDGDQFHPDSNVEKMRQGTPLSDLDRIAFLRNARQFLAKAEPLEIRITSVSALSRAHRAALQGRFELTENDTDFLSAGTNSNFEFLAPTAGENLRIVTIYPVKPYQIALDDLDRNAQKGGRQFEGRNGTQPHFITVTRENPGILPKQYAALEPPDVVNSIPIKLVKYRLPNGGYSVSNIRAYIARLLLGNHAPGDR